MPHIHESPTIQSTRILRAYRLNNVETVKLRNHMFVLDKSKQRELRIANQDIRLINRTLDYINSSSGQSPEGRPPEYVDTYTREESTPLFMYGDRIVSRKSSKRFRRVQSAHVSTSVNRRDSVDETGSQTSNDSVRQRPKSSPPKRITYISNDFETDTLISKSNPSRIEDNGISTSSAYLTQINEEDNDAAQTPLPSETNLTNRPKSRRRQLHSRNHDMTKKVNEARVQMMNARKKKPDPRQAWTSASAQTKQEGVLQVKKSMQGERQEYIDNKIKDFMDLHPLKKY